MQWREQGYQLLSGQGIEIGALHEPASLPRHCVVEYCDRISKQEAQRLFPEVCHRATPEVHTIVDIDRDGLVRFPSESKDFVVRLDARQFCGFLQRFTVSAASDCTTDL